MAAMDNGRPPMSAPATLAAARLRPSTTSSDTPSWTQSWSATACYTSRASASTLPAAGPAGPATWGWGLISRRTASWLALTVGHAKRDGAAPGDQFSASEPRRKREPTMSGSKTNSMKPEAVLAAVRAVPPSQDFVWDGQDEDDRPASAQPLRQALADLPRKRGRQAGWVATPRRAR